MVRVHLGAAVDALQPQEEVIGRGVAVADGEALAEDGPAGVAAGVIVTAGVVGAVGADPVKEDQGPFLLRHALPQLAGGPELVVDGDAVRQELGAELRRLALAEVQGREAQVHAPAAGTVGAGDAVVALLRPEPDGRHALFQQPVDVGVREGAVKAQGQAVLPLPQGVQNGASQFLRRLRPRDKGGIPLDEAAQRRALGGVELPVRGGTEAGVRQAGEDGRHGPPADGGGGVVPALGVAALHHPRPVEPQDVLLILRVLRHVRDEAARGVALGHQGAVGGGQGLLRQGGGQDVGRGGPGGGLGVGAGELVSQGLQALQVEKVGLIGRLAVLPIGGGTLLRVPGLGKATEPPGEDHGLPYGEVVLHAEAAVRLAHGEAVLPEGGDVLVEGGVLRDVGELVGVGRPRTGQAGPGGGDGDAEEQGERQCQGQNTLSHRVLLPFSGQDQPTRCRSARVRSIR